MDLAIPSIALTPTTQFGAQAPFQAGQVVDAEVLAVMKDGVVRLALPTGAVDVRTEVALTPGAIVKLAVQSTPAGLNLVILPAGPQQGGAARTVHGQTLPPATGSAFAATHADAAQPGAGGVAAARAASPSLPEVASPPIRPNLVVEALNEAIHGAAVRQGGMAPLFANIQALIGDRAGALPPDVREAAMRLLRQRVPLDDALKPADLKQALARSGLFLEAQLAGPGPAADGAAPSAVPLPQLPAGLPDDIKTALLLFKSVLRGWLAGGEARAPGPLPAATQPAIAGQGAVAPAAEPHSVPLPYRGGPMAAQPAVEPTLPPGAAPHDIAETLLGQTDAALARHTLMQAASLPDGADGEARHNDPAAQRLTFEIPFATPQGTATAQLEVSRDGREGARDPLAAVWRARFSIDVEPIGPVHAHVALIGERATVTLWAERTDSAERLADSRELLTEALRRAALEPGEIVCRPGAPRMAPGTQSTPVAPRAGHFLDKAT